MKKARLLLALVSLTIFSSVVSACAVSVTSPDVVMHRDAPVDPGGDNGAPVDPGGDNGGPVDPGGDN